MITTVTKNAAMNDHGTEDIEKETIVDQVNVTDVIVIQEEKTFDQVDITGMIVDKEEMIGMTFDHDKKIVDQVDMIIITAAMIGIKAQIEQ